MTEALKRYLADIDKYRRFFPRTSMAREREAKKLGIETPPWKDKPL